MPEKKVSSNTVTMKDGRSVDFGQRGKIKKQVEITGKGKARTVSISLDCLNGDTHTMSFGMTDPLLMEYAAHGVCQKLADSNTKATDPEDVSFGVARQITQLQEGTWVSRLDGAVRGFTDLLEALRRIRGYDVGTSEFEQLKNTLAAKDEADIKLIKTNSGIKAILAAIDSEKAIARAEKLAQSSGEDASALDALI